MKCFSFNIFFLIFFGLFMTLPKSMACSQLNSEEEHCHQTAKKKTQKEDCHACCQTQLGLIKSEVQLPLPRQIFLTVTFYYTSLFKTVFAEPDLRPPIG